MDEKNKKRFRMKIVAAYFSLSAFQLIGWRGFTGDENVCGDYYYHERNKRLCKPHNVRPQIRQTNKGTKRQKYRQTGIGTTP